MDNYIDKDERLEDLSIKGLKIIQNPKYFCFGMDAVLLSWFVSKEEKSNLKILDLGTGTGIIPLLIYAKSDNCRIDGLEIQPDLVVMAKRSVQLNRLEDNIRIIQGDLRNLTDEVEPNSYDVVVSNPPYMRGNSGLKNEHQTRTISRHEVSCTLEDVIRSAKRLLKDHGHLYLVHRPERLNDIFFLLRQYKMEVKLLQMVHSKSDKEANLVLIEGRKSGKPGLLVKPPLIIYNEEGQYTEELKRIYGL
ncbi:tRNA1(Val) (adenine(37)-N6)-methyltransferase [Eubacteriaceae bacterium ES2]|nr:tRNA1(Val) (adenine(37)-N6)-methyltransferase [Eubacteriaceae bacterium ES2]